jgi:malonyl-CoA/methylmalonyl-CoA synthetase
MPNLYSSIAASLQLRHTRCVLESEQQQLTGSQLDQAVARYAATLQALGLIRGERLAVQIDKSLTNIVLYLACLRVGAVYLPLNTAYQSNEVEYFLADARPCLLVTSSTRIAQLTPLAQRHSVTRVLTLDADGSGTLPQQVAAHCGEQLVEFSTVPCADQDLAVICYTSGTTGRSKGAMITHGNLISNAQALVQLWGFTDRDVLLHPLPLYHIHGLFVALHCALLSGAKVLLQRRFDADSVLRALPESTVLMGVPTYYTRLLAESQLQASVLGQMRLFVSGSAPLLAETFNEFERRTGQRILERYGMTETGMISSNPLHGERRVGSVGLALPEVDVCVLDEHGAALPRGDVGVVAVRGPNVCRGYWQQPDKTAAEFRADGFFITGDLGYVDAAGYLYLVGRAKDLIISGGLNVYPKEIEAALDALDAVEESAVFAIPHADLGESVAAAIVLETAAAQREHAQVTAEILSAVRSSLAGFKLPRQLFIVAELPRNAMGKVQKALLRERYGRRDL